MRHFTRRLLGSMSVVPTLRWLVAADICVLSLDAHRSNSGELEDEVMALLLFGG
jgi:hypothetical protein